jgi:flagellar biosynthesis component FlhA
MKRSDIQNKASGLGEQLNEKVGQNPLFVAGMIFAVGYFSGILWKLTFPLLIIAALGVTALWFLSDDETKIASSKDKGDKSKAEAAPKEKKSKKESKSQKAPA